MHNYSTFGDKWRVDSVGTIEIEKGYDQFIWLSKEDLKEMLKRLEDE